MTGLKGWITCEGGTPARIFLLATALLEQISHCRINAQVRGSQSLTGTAQAAYANEDSLTLGAQFVTGGGWIIVNKTARCPAVCQQ